MNHYSSNHKKKRKHKKKVHDLGYADFFRTDPSENSLPITNGSDVAFPNTNTTNEINIIRISDTTFILEKIGTYNVSFFITVTIAVANIAQLVVTLNGVELSSTIVKVLTGGTQIIGFFLIKTNIINSTLTIRNPISGNFPIVIGAEQNLTTSHLIINQLN